MKLNVNSVFLPQGLPIFVAVLVSALAQVGLLESRSGAAEADPLVQGFANPPNSARLRAYWWWLNGNVTKAAITRDLEEMLSLIHISEPTRPY